MNLSFFPIYVRACSESQFGVFNQRSNIQKNSENRQSSVKFSKKLLKKYSKSNSVLLLLLLLLLLFEQISHLYEIFLTSQLIYLLKVSTFLFLSTLISPNQVHENFTNKCLVYNIPVHSTLPWFNCKGQWEKQHG